MGRQQKMREQRSKGGLILCVPPSNERAFAFLRVLTDAGNAACASIGAVEAVQALMSATLNVALDRDKGVGMTSQELASWLRRLAADAEARAPRIKGTAAS